MHRRYMVQICVLSLLALLYGALTQKYRAYDIDNPWVLSSAYNYCHNGGEEDTFVALPYPAGMRAVHLFGKVQANIQCAVYNRTGWTPEWIVALNVIFGVASLSLWWSFFRRLGYREDWIAIYILMLGVTEPIVSMMEKARCDFLIFFLLSLALWFGVQGLELAALLVAFLATETHPMAITVVLLVTLFLAMRTRNWKMLTLKFGLSACAGAGFYFHLHPHAIQEMAQGVRPPFVLGGVWRAYFIDRHRHLPELLFFLPGAWLYWSQRARTKDRIVVWLALTVILLLFAQPHNNVTYVLYAMPFCLWIALEGYDLARKWLWIPGMVFLGILLQYAYLYRINLHEGFRQQDFAAVRHRIAESEIALGVPDSEVQICGDYSLWFAHPQNYRTCPIPWERADLLTANLFLCFDGPLQANGLSAPDPLSCPEVNNIVPLREMSSMRLRGHLLHIETRR